MSETGISRLPGRIPSLDGIRTLSFFCVFLGHAGIRAVPGAFGVTVFFFLSGFLITTLMRAEFEKTGAVSLRNFYLRRALRILPPFYIVLFGITAVAVMYPTPWGLTYGAMSSLCFNYANYWNIWHGIVHMPPGAAVYWSLAVEEHFYFLFPLIYLLTRRLGGQRQAILFWSLCAVVLAWRYVLVYHFHVSMYRTMFGTDTRFDSLLYGCALAVWKNPVLDEMTSTERTWKFAIVPAALLTLLACFVERDEAFRDTLRYSLQGIALTFLFVAAIRYSDWLPFRVLNTKPLIFLGALSYSLYLIHYAVLQNIWRLDESLSRIDAGALALAISIAAAWILQELVEKPCAKLRKLLSATKSDYPVTFPESASDAGAASFEER